MTTDTHSAILPRPERRSTGAAGHRSSPLRNLVVAEAKLALREPTSLIFGIGLPLVILVIFGSVPSLNQPQDALDGLSVVAVYVPILISLFLGVFAFVAVPGPLAAYREQGVLRRMAATPVPPSRVLAAHLLVNFGSALVSLLLLLGIGRAAFGVPLPRQGGGFALGYLLTVAALFAIGLWVSAVARTGKMAQAIGGALFYPLNFLGGLWLPRQEMPGGLRTVSDLSPMGAAVQVFQDASGGQFPPVRYLLVLAGYAAVFGWLAVRQFAWE